MDFFFGGAGMPVVRLSHPPHTEHHKESMPECHTDREREREREMRKNHPHACF